MKKIDGFPVCIQFIKNGCISRDVMQIRPEQVSSKISNHDLIIRFSPLRMRRLHYTLDKKDNLVVPTE